MKWPRRRFNVPRPGQPQVTEVNVSNLSSTSSSNINGGDISRAIQAFQDAVEAATRRAFRRALRQSKAVRK